MSELERIAENVAKALGLGDLAGIGWQDADRYWLYIDSSNLFSPYWQARCRDWLRAQGYWLEIAPEDNYESSAYLKNKSIAGPDDGVSITCPAAEFCARAIDSIMSQNAGQK